MSHANGGYGRPASRGGSKYDDYYEDDYDSDYDDRTGRRFKASGRGYDAERDRDFDREIIETERYRGVSFSNYSVQSLIFLTLIAAARP